MRKAIIAGLMAAGMLAGCGGTSDGEVYMSCANGTTCAGTAATCEAQCASASGDSKQASWITMYCCDGSECRSPTGPSVCINYCASRDGIC
ncbi:hypothetical protein D7X55_13825 [Corallococcus sp. AB049A]|uniref:Lipoprotein n=1 Tax=Corallococcus interemptor TaxID=2316720 RepID=A0A3A8PVS0_9BACT|nr:hypothetical protein [Corallococcus interemptor]RKH53877.1 hypothetical protein D7Y23_02460 [Corallococcus sp. AB050B]RKH60546.1 hypothetical protein D7X96_33395 [Corallococcus interemptor]RKI67281.1 hypothetical protein D7X55_13825 [Corallococcus sp. AB049A]